MISDDQHGNARDDKKRELDITQTTAADDKNPVKRMHHLNGKLKFGGGRQHFGSPWGSFANPFLIQKREKDNAKTGEVRSKLDKRVHRLQGNLQFGSAGTIGNPFGYPSSWQNPFNLKRKKDEIDNAKDDDSDLKRRAKRVNSADKDGSDDWEKELWNHAFRGWNREADDKMKTMDAMHKRRHLQTKLKFGGNYGGLQSGRSSWSHNLFRNINGFQARHK